MIKKYLVVLAWIVLFVTNASAQCTAPFSSSVSNLFDYKFSFDGVVYPGISYSWTFGDGGTSTDENPSHNYSTFGTYIVCLTIKAPTYCANGATQCDTVSIICPAQAGYTYSLGNDFAYDFAYSSGANDQVTFLWNFGDGGTSTSRTPTHVFAHTGVYDVCLTVTDVATGCSNKYCSDISVCVAQADFSHTNSNRFDYSFTNTSAGTDASTTYHWNFGDGDSSTLENPTHDFTSPGTYNVCLTIDVVDSGCTNQYCSLISVACEDSSNFTEVNTGGLTFQFTDLSTGEDNSVIYAWNFGDGEASSLKDPTHTFTQTGDLEACLTIVNVDQNCKSTYCANFTLACNDSAGFTYSHNGNIYEFSDASHGEDTTVTFAWTFGDGDTSSAKNPSHIYTALGIHQVCLTITEDDVCTSHICQNITVTCPLSASFTYSSVDSAIVFADASEGEDASAKYTWTFGDNDSSTLKNPTHVYASSGSYHVCLTVEDVDLNCSNQYCQDILINTAGCPDSAAFTYTSSANTFTFQNISKNVGNSAAYSWSFGDGDTSSSQNPQHTYTSPGYYQVCLLITDATNSCSSKFCAEVATCMDTASFTYTNSGVTYHFSDDSKGEDASVTFQWTFGDGSSPSGAQNPEHTFNAIGTFQVCLTINDVDVNCSNQVCRSITVVCPLASSFTYTNNDSSVSFQDHTSGEDNTATYAWSFGDNGSSTSQNPTHVYAASGTYQVCLTVTDGDLECSSQSCQSILVNIAGCKDVAAFTYTSQGDSLSFTNASKNIGSSASYNWTFGDGATSSVESPTHIYSGSGIYDVCLTINDTTNSCSTDSCQSINVVSGINQISASSYGIRIFPNPAAGLVNVDLSGFEARNIFIINQLGQQIKQVTPDKKGLTAIDISALTPGIYLVSAKSDEEVFSTTLIVVNK